MPDNFDSKTENFLNRWVPLADEAGATKEVCAETPKQVRQRLELFMKKVESQADEQLRKHKVSSVSGTLRWQLAFARARYPIVVTAAIMSICAAFFLVVTKENRHELRQSVNVSLPANNTLKEAESTIELLRTGAVELGERTDPLRVEQVNAVIQRKYRDTIEPNEEQLPSNVRGRLTEMVLVYNDSLTQWKKSKSAESEKSASSQVSPVNTNDFARVAEIFKVVEKDNPLNAEVLKNANIVSIDANKVTWSTSVPAQSWDDAALWNAAKQTRTTLSIQEQQGSYQKEFAPSKTASAPDR